MEVTATVLDVTGVNRALDYQDDPMAFEGRPLGFGVSTKMSDVANSAPSPRGAINRRPFSAQYNPETAMPAAYWRGRMMVRNALLSEASDAVGENVTDHRISEVRHHEMVCREYAARIIGA